MNDSHRLPEGANMKNEGVNVILLNDRNEVLLFLRDDKPDIPYPNMWCLLGGHMEPDESPKECLIRELLEEIGLVFSPDEVKHFVSKKRSYGIEHTFWGRHTLDCDSMTLTEGQCIRWFSRTEWEKTHLGYEDNQLLMDFFNSQLEEASRGNGN
jgi:8-oxo-dGTP diphosphatase